MRMGVSEPTVKPSYRAHLTRRHGDGGYETEYEVIVHPFSSLHPLFAKQVHSVFGCQTENARLYFTNLAII